MSSNTEKILRVVVTVVTSKGSKLAIVKKIADWPMAEQNEKMLEGLRAVASQREQDRPEKVDFVARNKAAVRPDRSGLGRKEYALIARAEVMAAASAHIDGGRAPPMPIHARKQTTDAPVDSSADLVRAAREEVERGLGITALEQQTRRPFRRR